MAHAFQDRDEALRQQAVDRLGYAGLRNETELDAIVQNVAASYNVPYAAVSIIDRDRQILVSRTGIGVSETPRAAAFCAIAIHRPGEMLLVPDAAKDKRFSAFPTVCGVPFVRFYAGMPIVSQDGYALGALCVADVKPHDHGFDGTTLTFLARKAERVFWR